MSDAPIFIAAVEWNCVSGITERFGGVSLHASFEEAVTCVKNKMKNVKTEELETYFKPDGPSASQFGFFVSKTHLSKGNSLLSRLSADTPDIIINRNVAWSDFEEMIDWLEPVTSEIHTWREPA